MKKSEKLVINILIQDIKYIWKKIYKKKDNIIFSSETSAALYIYR